MITQQKHIQGGRPHFLLLVDADDSGKWHFTLEPLDRGETIEVSDYEVDVRGERLELLTVIRGLEALDQPSRVTLVTSSRYVARGICYGLEAWRRGNWHWERFGSMVPISNHDLWERLDVALRVHDVRCKHYRWDRPHVPSEETPDMVHTSSGSNRRRVATNPPHFAASTGRGPQGEPHRSAPVLSRAAASAELPTAKAPRPSSTSGGVLRALPALVRQLLSTSTQAAVRLG